MKFDGKNILSMDGFFEIFITKSDITKASKFTLDDIKRIGDQLNIDWTKIDQNEFHIGLNIELEHGTKFPETNVTDDDEIMTAKIALAHINEFPKYYSEQNGLPEMEKRLKGIKKGKVYVNNPQDAPKDKKVQEGERGGIYYESEGKISSKKPKSEIEELPNLKEIVGQCYSMIPQHLKNEISKINEIMNLGKTSKNGQIDNQGNYNSERIQLHNQIMNDFIGKSSWSIQKVAILLGGPTAAGKSTLLKNQNINFDQFVNISNDDIKEKLPGYNKINAMLYHDEARDIVEKLLKKSLIEKRNIIIDGTMRDFNKEITKIKLLKENGYKVKVISIIADPQIILKRATNRFIREKRFVPLDHIAKTSKEINLVQHKYKDYADEYELYDSSEFPSKRLL